MPEITPPAVYVKETGTAKGRGVFAGRSISAGEMVEACPVVTFARGRTPLQAELSRMVFNWSYLVRGKQGRISAFAMGYGALYNHNNPANMRYEADATTRVLRFVAVRDIRADEELTINYNAHGGGPEWSDNAWFERKKIEPIIEPPANGGGIA